MPPFELVTDAFRFGTAIWLSEFCRLIYRQEEREGKKHAGATHRAHIYEERGQGWKETKFFNGLEPDEKRKRRFWRPALPVEDTQAALLVNEELGCSVLVFRGTLGQLDLLTDMAFLAWPLRLKLKAAAHHGFRDALETVWERIRERLLLTPGKVFLTGHSLGGALATLAACRMARRSRSQGSNGSSLHVWITPRRDGRI